MTFSILVSKNLLLDCNLPENFQSWYGIMHLHIWMLMVKNRTINKGRRYNQELVNWFFYKIEQRLHENHVF